MGGAFYDVGGASVMPVESIPEALQSFELMLHSYINVSFPPNFSISHTWSVPHMFLFVDFL